MHTDPVVLEVLDLFSQRGGGGGQKRSSTARQGGNPNPQPVPACGTNKLDIDFLNF